MMTVLKIIGLVLLWCVGAVLYLAIRRHGRMR
jgi:hypothetical protein